MTTFPENWSTLKVHLAHDWLTGRTSWLQLAPGIFFDRTN